MSEDYFKHTIPPRRESRLKTSTAYGGSLCQFGHGSFGCGGSGCDGKKRQDGYRPCMELAERGFSQGSICLILPALGTIGTIPNTAVLLHGAVGCGTSMQAVSCNFRSGANARWGQPGETIWMSTGMNEVDVITGGEAKLRKALEEIDFRWHPASIIVVSGCVPGVTGDDVEAVVAPPRRKKCRPGFCRCTAKALKPKSGQPPMTPIIMRSGGICLKNPQTSRRFPKRSAAVPSICSMFRRWGVPMSWNWNGC